MENSASPSAPRASSVAPLIAATVALLVGMVAGYAFGIAKSSDNGYERGYEQARMDIRERIDEGGGMVMLPGGTATETFTISGTVTGVSGNVITVASDTRNPDPTSAQFPTVRRVRVTGETSILLSSPKSADAYAAELDAYFAAVNALANAGQDAAFPVSPMPFSVTDALADDLHEGMHITVTAASDIGMAESFDAAEITAQSQE